MLGRRSVFAGIAVTGIVLALAGCGSSSKPKGASTTTAPGTTSPQSTAPPTTATSHPPTPATGAVPWPAPADAMARTRAAGLVPKGYETLQHHVHSHLDIYIDGVHQVVPAGIGINIKDPAVHKGTIAGNAAYGGIRPPCKQPCISPLHTHATTGILHTESPTNVDNKLGEFFVEWNVKLDANCVGGYCKPLWPIAVYVNGNPFNGDPAKIALTDHKEIAIVIGTPPKTIPAGADFTTD